VKVQCNLRLLDNIEEIGHNDVSIWWSSNEDYDRRNSTFELLRTLLFLELHNKQLDFKHVLTTLTTITHQSSWFICINAAAVPYDYESNCSRRYSLASLFIMTVVSSDFEQFSGFCGFRCGVLVGGCGPRNQVPEAENLPLNLDKMCTYLAKIMKMYSFLINNTPENCTSQRESVPCSKEWGRTIPSLTGVATGQISYALLCPAPIGRRH